MEPFSAASHNEVLQLVVQIAALLFAARLFGGIATRFRQPTVVGEILAGVILGPSLLSGLVPVIGRWIVPQTAVQGYMLEVVALVGVMLLLVVTGLETDLGLIRRRIGVAAGIAVGGLIVPFASGLVLGFMLPELVLADPAQRTIFALFLATALSISAIPVLAKILMDLDLMRREFGQTVLAAGMIDDITGWTLLGLVTALAGAEALSTGTVVQTVGMVALFVLATASVGRFLVDKGLTLVQDRFRGPDFVLTLVVVLAFAWGGFSQAMNLEPVIGAFAIGILFGRLPRMPSDTVRKLESITLAVFAPIFFAVAGLKVNIRAILEPDLLLITIAVIAVATFGKVVGAYLGARYLSKQDHWSSLAYGAGLNARGAVEIIVATIGLSLGILSQEMFSIIVVMAVVTSLMAPFAIKYFLARVEPGEEEKQRLVKEEILARSFAAGIRRILVPVRPREHLAGTQTIQAALVARLARSGDISTSLIAVYSNGQKSMANRYLDEVSRLFDKGSTTTRAISGDEPVDHILREAEADYDLLVIGTPALADSDQEIFGRVIDDLIKLSRCPTLVIRGDDVPSGWKPNRILVPISGSTSSRNAADLALAVAGSDSVVTGVHVVVSTRVPTSRYALGGDVTEELETVAAQLGQQIETFVLEAIDVESGILEAVQATNADLMVMGTSVRAGSRRLYLGPRVEQIIRTAPCPVVILNS